MSSELTKIQEFPGEVKVTNDLRVDTSTVSLDSDTSRVGINKSVPTTSLDVSGNLHTTSDLTVGTNLLHVDQTNKRVIIGGTSTSKQLDVFPGTSNWCSIGPAKMGGNADLPKFAHVNADDDNYAFAQDNTTGDVIINNFGSVAYEYTGLMFSDGYDKKNFVLGSITDPRTALQLGGSSSNQIGPMKSTLPYIVLDAPSTSLSSATNFYGCSDSIVKFDRARHSNILTFSRSNNSITVPTGYKGLYRIACQVSIGVGSTADETRSASLYAYNRTTLLARVESNLEHVFSTTYNIINIVLFEVCNDNDVITFKTVVDGNSNNPLNHYPNSHATMFMINPLT